MDYKNKNQSKQGWEKKKNPDGKKDFSRGAKPPRDKNHPAGRGKDFSPKPRKADIDAFAGEASDEAQNEGMVAGRNAVIELLKSGRDIDKIFVQRAAGEGSVVMIIAQARERAIPVVEVEKAKLDNMTRGVPHQGVIAMAAEKEYCTVEDILEIARERGEKPIVVISDGICDPHNLGALIRSAEGVGAHGIIIPKRRAAGLTFAVSKASAGALEHMAVAKVSNIASAIDKLKENGLWIFAAESGGAPYYETDFKCACAIIFGSEGDGVSKLVKEKSDFIVSIPMYGKINSFNVSAAAAVILAEASRQHRNG